MSRRSTAFFKTLTALTLLVLLAGCSSLSPYSKVTKINLKLTGSDGLSPSRPKPPEVFTDHSFPSPPGGGGHGVDDDPGLGLAVGQEQRVREAVVDAQLGRGGGLVLHRAEANRTRCSGTAAGCRCRSRGSRLGR